MGQLQLPAERTDLAAEQADTARLQHALVPPDAPEERQMQILASVGDDGVEHLPLAGAAHTHVLHPRQDGRDITRVQPRDVGEAGHVLVTAREHPEEVFTGVDAVGFAQAAGAATAEHVRERRGELGHATPRR